jgi:hypothetical protein
LRRKVKSGFQDTSPLAARSFIDGAAACTNPLAATVAKYAPPASATSGCTYPTEPFANPLPPNPSGPAYCNVLVDYRGVVLSPGMYIFGGGKPDNLNLSTLSDATTPAGGFGMGGGSTMTCPTCTAANGVTLYFTAGSLDGGNENQYYPYGLADGGVISIGAGTSSINGSIPGVVIMDGNSDPTNPDLAIVGGGGASSLVGSIYAPNTVLDMMNGSTTLALTGDIIAGTLIAGQGGGVTVTPPAGGGSGSGTPGSVIMVR